MDSTAATGSSKEVTSTSRKDKKREKEIDEKFAWSEYSSVCVELLEQFMKLEQCQDFNDEPDWDTFLDGTYRQYVPDPLALSIVLKRAKRTEQSKGKKVNKVSIFIRKVKQVFVNALRYWRHHSNLREVIYMCLSTFNKLLFEKLQGLKEIMQRDRFVDEATLSHSRLALDALLLREQSDVFMFPYGRFQQEPPHFKEFVPSPLCLLEVIERLNYEDYYSDVSSFYGDVLHVFSSWHAYFESVGNPTDKMVKCGKVLTKEFKGDMKKIMRTKAPVPAISGSTKDVFKKVMSQLKKLDSLQIFALPVAYEAMGLLDYPKVIKKPMDFGTITKNISKYPTVGAFCKDVRLVFKNCETYNQNPLDPVRQHCDLVKKGFEKLYRDLLQPIDSDNSGGPTSAPVAAADDEPAPLTKVKLKTKAKGKTKTSKGAPPPAVVTKTADVGFPQKSVASSVLKDLMKMPEATDFNYPVDWEGLGLTDYPLVIKKPMDFGTVKANLEKDVYTSLDEFKADVELVFTNCTTFNRQESPEYPILTWCKKLKAKFHSKLQHRLSKPKTPGSTPSSLFPRKECSQLLSEIKKLSASHPFRAPVPVKELEGYEELIKKPMDLRTITQKLSKYKTVDEFAEDFRLVFNNALLYNTMDVPGYPPIRKWAKELLDLFEEKFSRDVLGPMQDGARKKKSKTGKKGGDGSASEPATTPTNESAVVGADSDEMIPPPPPPPGESEAKNTASSPPIDDGLPPPPPPPPPVSGVVVKIRPPGEKRKADASPGVGAAKKAKKQKTPEPPPPPPVVPVERDPLTGIPIPPKREMEPYEVFCSKIVSKLARTDWGGKYFGKPVLESWPDMEAVYLAVVEQPTDLRTILEKIYAGNVYSCSNDVLKELNLMFENALKFNSDESTFTRQMRQQFEYMRDIYVAHNFAECPNAKDNELRDKKRKEREELLKNESTSLISSDIKRMLKKLKQPRNKCILAFLDPVDTTHFADYLTVVKKPMDFGTLGVNLASSHYHKPGGLAEFIADIRLITDNCLLYNREHNPANGPLRNAAEEVRQQVEAEWAQITIQALVKRDRAKLLHDQAIETELEAALAADPNAASKTEAEINKLKSEITQRYELETQRSRNAKSKRRRDDETGVNNMVAYGDATEETRQRSISLGSELSAYSEEEILDDSDDETFSPIRNKPRQYNGVRGGAATSGVTVHDQPSYAPVESSRKRFERCMDSREYEQYVTQVKLAKEDSIKRAMEMLKEQEAILLRKQRREQREKEQLEESTRSETNGKSILSEEGILKVKSLKIALHRKKKRKEPIRDDEEEIGQVELRERMMLAWQDKVSAFRGQDSKPVDQKKSTKANENHEHVSSTPPTVMVPCIIPRDMDSLQADDSQPGVVNAASPSAPVSTGKKKGKKNKGKQVSLIYTAVCDPTITARVSQRVVDFGNQKLCFGMVILSLSTPEEDLQLTKEKEKVEQAPTTTQSCTASCKLLNGTSAPCYVPIPAKNKGKKRVPGEVSFSSPSSEGSEVFYGLLSSVSEMPPLNNGGSLVQTSPKMIFAKRFLERKKECELDETVFEFEEMSNAMSSWNLNAKFPFMTCCPEIQVRGSRPFVEIRFVSLLGALDISVDGVQILMHS